MRGAVAAVSAAALLLPFAGQAQAVGSLDQSVPTTGVTPSSTTLFQMSAMAQTFRAGLTGQLDRVSLYVGSGNFTLPTFRLQVWTVDTTRTTLAPVGTPPSYQLQLQKTQRDWENFDLNPTVAVQAGRQYAIVVTAVSVPLELRWYFMSNWDYPDGDLYCCTSSGLTKDTTRDFAFQTYVTGGSTAVNAPPTLDPPVTSAVQTAEGSAPTNSGDYNDTDGDSVALTASTGTLTTTGTASHGTWHWTGSASDEDVPTQTVVITADDGHNPKVSSSFTVSVYAVNPSVSIAATGAPGPTTAAATKINEGSPLSFTGTVSSPAKADNSAGFTYAWSVTKDGAPYPAASSTGATLNFTPDDEGVYVLSLSATDDGHMTGTGSISVTVGDVLPTATITAVTPALTAPKIVLPYELVTFSGTFTDPGTADPHAASWDFGDGTAQVSGWTVTHYYSAPGAYPVTLTVSQGEDPGVGTAQATVQVLTPAQALTAIDGYVQGLSGLNKGQKNSLTAKLDAASASIARGNDTAATNQLNAFLNELMADLNTGKVSSAEATNLEDDVAAVKASLGDYNRLLDFWPLGI